MNENVKYDFVAVYHEWLLIKNGEVLDTFGDITNGLPIYCSEKNARIYAEDLFESLNNENADEKELEDIINHKEEIVDIMAKKIFNLYGKGLSLHYGITDEQEGYIDCYSFVGLVDIAELEELIHNHIEQSIDENEQPFWNLETIEQCIRAKYDVLHVIKLDVGRNANDVTKLV